MARRVTPSQYNAIIRQQQQKQREAIRKYNQEVNRVNNHNKRVVDNHNRELRQYNQKRKSAVAKYNNAVRSHNAQVERDRHSRLRSLRALTNVRFVEVRDSAFELSSQYDCIDNTDLANEEIFAAARRESSNSTNLAYTLNSNESAPSAGEGDSGILDYLSDLSEDLCDRWRGALFALNPTNTDAARHFCTSVREIFTEILNRWADDDTVIGADANCEKTQQGTPSRRAKIRFLLDEKGANSPEMLGFVEKDIDDILQLFPVFNKATHGHAGTISFASLEALRQRVEGGIMFLATIASR